MTAVLLMVLTTITHAEFPTSFPPREVDQINQIVESYERGEIPHYRSELISHFFEDEVIEFGSAAGVVAGLQLHSKFYSAKAREALVLGVGRMAAAGLHLGGMVGQFGNEESGVREHLHYLLSTGYEPELNAILFLQQVAKGRKLKAQSAVATTALKLIYTKADLILSRKGTFKDASAYDDEDVQSVLGIMFSIDEAAALKDVRRYAERGLYTDPAQYFIVNRLAELDQTRMWQVCHDTLVSGFERKAAK